MALIENPPQHWIERLRRGHRIWLVKENEEAAIEFAYEPPEPGHSCGRMGIWRQGHVESWFVGLEGQGINGSQLMLPLEGNLPDAPEPLPEPLIRQMQRAIESLEDRVRRLERRGRFYFDDEGMEPPSGDPSTVGKSVAQPGRGRSGLPSQARMRPPRPAPHP